MNINEESVELHRKQHGKLEIKSKVPLLNRHDLSLAYTPGVAGVCLEISKNPNLAEELTLKYNTIALVSDGSAILGLGNLGAKAAIPVMEGKAILFKEFAGVDAFPICLDTQDTEEIIKTVKQIAPVFGGINLEDISAPRCFEIENRLIAELDIPVMHDDQHGTAVVVLAGLINATRLKRIAPKNAKLVINGVGAAGTAITHLIQEYGFQQIILCDTKGAIYEGREDLSGEKLLLAKSTNPEKIKGGLTEVLRNADIFIGVSKGGLLKKEMIQSMNKQPIIFALANPMPEIMPDEAMDAGAFIVATGRSDFPNQINNVLAFPGIFRGALDNKVKRFTSKMFLAAANALADSVQSPSPNAVLPEIFDKNIVSRIANTIRE